MHYNCQTLNTLETKDHNESPGAHVSLIATGKYLHSLSLPLKLSSAECKYLIRRVKKVLRDVAPKIYIKFS